MKKKRCSKCKKMLPLVSFSKCKAARDGRAWRCLECNRTYLREARALLTLKERVKYQEDLDFRKRKIARCMEYQRKYPERYKARRAVMVSVRKGALTKPVACEDCGVAKNVQAHHEDYAKPLEVEWLCSVCHGKRHRTM
jgi:hypothetical protein